MQAMNASVRNVVYAPVFFATPVVLLARCLIPQFDGAIFSLEWKEALWDKYFTAAPRPRTPSEQQYSDPLADRVMRSMIPRSASYNRGAEPRTRHQCQNSRQVA